MISMTQRRDMAPIALIPFSYSISFLYSILENRNKNIPDSARRAASCLVLRSPLDDPQVNSSRSRARGTLARTV